VRRDGAASRPLPGGRGPAAPGTVPRSGPVPSPGGLAAARPRHVGAADRVLSRGA
jgi:hypothetical protein